MHAVRLAGLWGIAIAGAISAGCFQADVFPGDRSHTGGGTATGGAGGGVACSPASVEQDCQEKDSEPCTVPACVNGHCTELPDNSATAKDDGNPCTDDKCVSGVSTSVNDDSNSCGANPPKTHCEDGICIGCETRDDCDAMTECKDWSCADKQCVATNGETALFLNPEHDCFSRSCTEQGVLETKVDPDDKPPVDDKECTVEECGPNGELLYTAQTNQPCGTGPTCTLAVVTAKGTCAADGECQPGTETACEPYNCNAAGDACTQACTPATQENDCTEAYCDNGECKAKLDKGAACQSPGACLTGFCADGVCCNGPCGSACVSCNLDNPGTCSDLSKGVPDTCAEGKACKDGACDNLNGKKAVGDACATSADCINSDGDLATQECVNLLCRLLVGQPCEVAKPWQCATNRCDVATHTCQECNDPMQCSDMLCDLVNKRCQFGAGGVCGTNADCQSGHTCTAGTCQ